MLFFSHCCFIALQKMAESVGPAMCPGVLYLSLFCFVQIAEVNDSVVDQIFSKICHFMLIAL